MQYFDLVTEESVLLAMQHANTQWNALGTVEEYICTLCHVEVNVWQALSFTCQVYRIFVSLV